MTRLLAGLLMAGVLSACAGVSEPEDTTARVVVSLVVPSVVRSVDIEISGPGLDSTLRFSRSVVPGTSLADTLLVRAGSDRRVLVTGRDAAGIATHRGETTVSLQAGINPTVSLPLDPLQGSLTLVVTFRSARIIVGDTTTRTMAVGDSVVVTASAVAPDGSAVGSAEIYWGSSNPAVCRVAPGRVVGVRGGAATLVVSYAGQAVRIPVTVTEE